MPKLMKFAPLLVAATLGSIVATSAFAGAGVITTVVTPLYKRCFAQLQQQVIDFKYSVVPDRCGQICDDPQYGPWIKLSRMRREHNAQTIFFQFVK